MKKSLLEDMEKLTRIEDPEGIYQFQKISLDFKIAFRIK